MSRNWEAALQAAIVSMVRAEAPDAVAFGVLNDGLFTKAEAAKRKWMGLLAGVPDVAIVAPGGLPAFFEVKAPGGKLSAEQVETIAKLEAAGARVAVVRTVDEARAALRAWGVVLAA